MPPTTGCRSTGVASSGSGNATIASCCELTGRSRSTWRRGPVRSFTRIGLSINMDTTNDTYVIWSIEHTAWWRPGQWGYADTLAGAGRYSRADAETIVARANIRAFHECMIPVAALALTIPDA